jgi:hypothetical protein
MQTRHAKIAAGMALDMTSAEREDFLKTLTSADRKKVEVEIKKQETKP